MALAFTLFLPFFYFFLPYMYVFIIILLAREGVVCLEQGVRYLDGLRSGRGGGGGVKGKSENTNRRHVNISKMRHVKEKREIRWLMLGNHGQRARS